MGTTPDFGIPELSASQANPEITHNEAILLLQALLNGVIDKDLTAPPGSPNDGDAYIVPSGASGAWSGWTNRIAVRYNGAWYPIPGYNDAGTLITIGARQEGMKVFVRDEGVLYTFAGSPLAWIKATNAVGAQGSLSGDQTVTADTWTKILLDTADHNDNGIFQPGNQRFVMPADGLYTIFAKVGYINYLIGSPPALEFSPIDSVRIKLYLNGSAVDVSENYYFNDWGHTEIFLTTSWSARLSQGDIIDVRVYFETNTGKVLAGSTYAHVYAA